MSLSGFYKKAKKKLEDWGGGIKNTFSKKKNSVVDFFNNASSGRQERVNNFFDSFDSSENSAQRYQDEARRIRQETARRRAEEATQRMQRLEQQRTEANRKRKEQGRLYIGNDYLKPKDDYKDVSLWQETKAKPKAVARYGAAVTKGLSDIGRDVAGWSVGKVKGEERKRKLKQSFDNSLWGKGMTKVGEFSRPQSRAEEKAMKSIEVADIMTGAGTLRQVPKFTGKTDKLGRLVKKKEEAILPKPKREKNKQELSSITPEVNRRKETFLKDYSAGKNHKWKFKEKDRVALTDGRNLIVDSYYAKEGAPRYVVYPPGKSKSPGHFFWVHEKDLIARGSGKNNKIGKNNRIKTEKNQYTMELIRDLSEKNMDNKKINRLLYSLRGLNGNIDRVLSANEKKFIDKLIHSSDFKEGVSKSKKELPELLPRKLNKYYKNAYKVADNQKKEAIVGKYPEILVKEEQLPRDIYLEKKAYNKILNKHNDFKNLNFNKKLGFVKSINEPESFRKISGNKPRINLIRDIGEFDKKTLNVVGTKPIVKDGRGYVNTSFLANKKGDVRRILSEGRPIPSSPVGVSSLPHLDKIHQTPLSNSDNIIKFPKNQDQDIDAVLKGIESAKKKLPKHTYSQDDIAKVSGEALYKTDKEFMPIFSKWVADRELAKTKAYEVASKVQVPRGKERQIIDALEGVGSAEGVEGPVRYIRNAYNKLFAEAKQAGVNMNYLDNYITHIWKESPYEVAKKYQTAKKTFQFSGERKVPTYAEGLKMGLTPRYTNPRQIIGHYTQKLEEVKANIRFLESLKREGHIVDATIGANNPAFTAITAPGFEKSMSGIRDGVIVGNYYAPHDVARKINNALHNPDAGSRLQRVVGGLAKISGAIQDLTMSGGIPKTPFNAFGIAQGTKEVLAGRFLSPVMNMARSSSGYFSRKFFEKNLGSIKEMQARNIPIKTTLNLDSLGETTFLQKAFFGNISNERGAGKLNAVRNAWHKTMNEPTFARYMSQLQIQLFNDIKKKALRGGVMRRARNEEEAADIAAQAVKNFYGLQNTAKQAIKDPLGKDFISTIFFAPRYRSAMINFWWNNVKSFAKPHKLDNATNVKFAAGALLNYAAYDYANYALNGRHLWDNPQNKEDKLLIPTSEDNKWTDGKTLGLPFLSSIATMPRLGYRTARNLARGDIEAATKDTLATASSKMIAPFMQISRNENYFGQPIYNKNDSTSGRFKDIGLHLAKEYNHPYIGAGIDMVAGGKARGEVAGRALELPVRFYNPKSIEGGFYYTSKNEVLKKASKEAKAAFERIYGDGQRSDEDKFYDENGLAFNDKRDKMSSALLKLNNFSGLKLQEEIDRRTAERTGSPLNPFWNLSDDQKRVVLTLDTLYDGEKTKSTIQSANIEWLKPYWNERNYFFDELQRLGRFEGKQNVVKYDGNGPINVAMIDTLLPSDEINEMSEIYYALPSGTGQRTAFLNQYPQLKNYWDAKNEKTNLDRIALGLPPKENSFAGGGYGGYGGGGFFFPRKQTSGLNYDKNLSLALLSRYKADGDYKGWKEEAKNLKGIYEEMLKNPKLTGLERTRIENSISSLTRQKIAFKKARDKEKKKAKGKPPIFKYDPFDLELYRIEQMLDEMGKGGKIASLPSPGVAIRGVRNVGRRYDKNIRL